MRAIPFKMFCTIVKFGKQLVHSYWRYSYLTPYLLIWLPSIIKRHIDTLKCFDFNSKTSFHNTLVLPLTDPFARRQWFCTSWKNDFIFQYSIWPSNLWEQFRYWFRFYGIDPFSQGHLILLSPVVLIFVFYFKLVVFENPISEVFCCNLDVSHSWYM